MRLTHVLSVITLLICLASLPAYADSILEVLNPWTAGATTSNQATTAGFRGGVTADGGKSFATTFTADQKIDVLVDIQPAPEHVGKEGVIYFVAKYNDDWYMKNSKGEWQSWDFQLVSLVPNTGPKTLQALESLKIQEQLSGLPGKFLVYVGYKVDTDIQYNLYPLQFSVTASDNTPINIDPNNALPVADAGSDKDVNEGAQVVLDGSKSKDADGSIVSYLWEQTNGVKATLSFTNASKLNFTTPQVDSATDLQFKLTVTDDKGEVASDTATVTVRDVAGGVDNPVCGLHEILQNGSCVANTPICVAPQTLQNGVCTSVPASINAIQGKVIDDILVGATITAYLPGSPDPLGNATTSSDGSYLLPIIQDQAAYYLVSTGGAVNGQQFLGSLKALCLPQQKRSCHLTPYSTLLVTLGEQYSGTYQERLAYAQQQVSNTLGLNTDPFVLEAEGQVVSDVNLVAWRTSLSSGAKLEDWLMSVLVDIADNQLENGELLAIFPKAKTQVMEKKIQISEELKNHLIEGGQGICTIKSGYQEAGMDASSIKASLGSLITCDKNNESLFMAFVGSEPTTTLDITSTAVALVILQPKFTDLDFNQYSAIAERIKSHSLFADLRLTISDDIRLLGSLAPLNPTLSPLTAQLAARIGAESDLDTFKLAIQKKSKLRAKSSSSSLFNENFKINSANKEIVVNNNYSIAYSIYKDSKFELADERKGAVALDIDLYPSDLTIKLDAAETKIGFDALGITGTGLETVTFTRGGGDWLPPNLSAGLTPETMATWVNMLNGVELTINISSAATKTYSKRGKGKTGNITDFLIKFNKSLDKYKKIIGKADDAILGIQVAIYSYELIINEVNVFSKSQKDQDPTLSLILNRCQNMVNEAKHILALSQKITKIGKSLTEAEKVDAKAGLFRKLTNGTGDFAEDKLKDLIRSLLANKQGKTLFQVAQSLWEIDKQAALQVYNLIAVLSGSSDTTALEKLDVFAKAILSNDEFVNILIDYLKNTISNAADLKDVWKNKLGKLSVGSSIC